MGEAPRLTRPDGSLVNQMLNLSAYAEMMLVHEHACVAIDPEMPLDRAAVIGSSPYRAVSRLSMMSLLRSVISCKLAAIP